MIKNIKNPVLLGHVYAQRFLHPTKYRSKYLELKKPWMTVKENNQQKSESATTLYVAAEILRIGSCLLYPIMPSKTNAIINSLYKSEDDHYDTSFGLIKPNAKINIISNIFPRIE